MQRHVLPILILALAIVVPARASHHHKLHSTAASKTGIVLAALPQPVETTLSSSKGCRLVAQVPVAEPREAKARKSVLKVATAPLATPVVAKPVPQGRLARITAYWTNEDYWTSQHMSSTGVHLQEGRSCAVDPKKIPYGSVVQIPGMGNYVAVDTGSAVVSRQAAVGAAHTADQRQALVVDLFFENRKDAEQFAAHGPTFAAVSWTKPLTAADAPQNPRALPAVVTPPAPVYELASAPSMDDMRMPLNFRAPQM
jgi:3D (Asp-Asp-Asp) domain-containing protein